MDTSQPDFEPAVYRLPFDVLLRTLREEQRLTREELAARAGMSSDSIAALERGKNHPRLSTLRRLVDGLGLSSKEKEAFLNAAMRSRPKRSSPETTEIDDPFAMKAHLLPPTTDSPGPSFAIGPSSSPNNPLQVQEDTTYREFLQSLRGVWYSSLISLISIFFFVLIVLAIDNLVDVLLHPASDLRTFSQLLLTSVGALSFFQSIFVLVVLPAIRRSDEKKKSQ
jgi:transcriptional regulator with XRE-family HTH domain